MPVLSPTLTNLIEGGSDGWEVFMRARKMIANGTPVTELTIGEHDIRTDPSILAAMDVSARGGHTGYATVPGIAELRAEVAARVQTRTGVPTEPENVMITPGGQSALFASHLAACPFGQKALYLDPYYATYPGTLRGVGAVAVPIQTRAEDGFQPDAREIDAHADGAASLLINSPNNPTGVIYTRETLEGIADVCKRHDLWLISDEVYDTQVWEGAHLSPRALPDMAERTLVIGSMSKSHAMTGSRIGWIVGPKDAIAHIANLATHTTYGVAGFVQDAALFALREGPEFEAKIAAPFERRRALTVDILKGQNHVKLIPADGAMYVMLNIRATGLSGEDFANQLLDTHHIAVMPGESFGKAAAGHIRVAMTIDDERYAEALRTLCEYVASLCE
ncbi:arginine:pyruvate transaminase [Planktotalea frisia]|uniref:Aminotransferase n=1 Tax=Planktotalea frisia TaxID=696762 RepID=A0A1L9NYU7_9RHOB|nr:aminotransferase class I/II-fold pyridoxal phosphate-dependent enzyme [Planktotalea frisia]OJI94436.1 arginine--pyruvate transaminase AruH [Planktotalea frisia]PZX30058.1 arginine:pyruvate transaminase [Planktotalea frisia]